MVGRMSELQPGPAIDLGAGVAIPQVGFGVFAVPADETERTVAFAFECGYRHVDTAAIYRNEEGVGRAVLAADIPRDELFVTTKVWNDAHGRDATLKAFDRSLGRLAIGYVDLYLIHWPAPANDRFVESWKALLELQEAGRVRAVGVSNFRQQDLRRIIDETGVAPSINQIELHPLLQQEELRAVHAEHRIVTEAWSPLAQGGRLLADPVITAIADAHGRTPAQVVLRWHVHLGHVVIPKSVTPSRIRENIDLYDFELSAADLEAIRGLDRGIRTGMDPDVVR
jgi:2,5-diketo-D-gluconate reductase A